MTSVHTSTTVTPPWRPRPACAGIDGRHQSESLADIGGIRKITNFSVNSFLWGRLRAQAAAVTGAHNNSWSNGWNKYVALGYNLFNQQQNDVWVLADFYFGNDMPSIMSPFSRSGLCTGTCPPGISDLNFRTSNTPGGAPIVNAPIEEADDFFAWRLSVFPRYRLPLDTQLSQIDGVRVSYATEERDER